MDNECPARKRRSDWFYSLLVAVALGGGILAGAMLLQFGGDVEATDVPPAVESGSPSCSDFDSGWTELKVVPPGNGLFSDGTLQVTISGFNSPSGTFDWSSNIGVDAAFVKGGPRGNLYRYDPPMEAPGDTDLSTPISPKNGQAYGISHISFCYDLETPAPTFTPSRTPTATYTPTPTYTPVPLTNTPTPANTPTSTPTTTPTATLVPPASTATATRTATPTATRTSTPATTATVTATATAAASATPTSTATPGGGLPGPVEMRKDVDLSTPEVDSLANLWLCEGPACVLNGEGELVVAELVSSISDPDGLGAYEFQLKFDHKIFDIAVEDAGFLGSTGRTVDCSMTVISENDIRFDCRSSGPVPGPTGSGVLAFLHVLPEADLKYRLTPGRENGVVRTILDENCELADVYRDPLADADGNLLPGILPGGSVAVCSDATITVRILEADLNLDCEVNIIDNQLIAFRYGAVFGDALYDPWYDLEPALKDMDIDIKDVQTVLGRNGSVCGGTSGAGTIPPQPPMPPPP